MIQLNFKCVLLSDIVLNASLATEGAMKSLNHIPGANFLGIVASNGGYEDLKSKGLAKDIFHSNKVVFENAYLSINNESSFPIPFCFFQDKLNNDLSKDSVWVHHALSKENHETLRGSGTQLKQVRSGFMTRSGHYSTKIDKQFVLKSAHDRNKRRSADGKMFGFEAIKKDQIFSFKILCESDKYVDEIKNRLQGIQSIGKSKSAEFGRVRITLLEESKLQRNTNILPDNKRVVVYAKSDLALFNHANFPTCQPNPIDFGLNKEAKVDWNKSQIRESNYSPWNVHRNTSDAQRICIAKGSIIVFKEVENINPQIFIGGYTSEGLGKIEYNPVWLIYDNEGRLSLSLNKVDNSDNYDKTISRPSLEVNPNYIKVLERNRAYKQGRDKVYGIANTMVQCFKVNGSVGTNSQWGIIRSVATKAKSLEKCRSSLLNGFEKKDSVSDRERGILLKGVAYDRFWGKNGKHALKELKLVFDKIDNYTMDFECDEKISKELKHTAFIKFAAQMAK